MKRTLKVLFVAACVIALFSACAVASEPEATPIAKDVLDETTDAMGQAITQTDVFTSDMTIISTAPSITEILFELGVGDQIVGVDAISNYPEAANAIQKIGDYSGFDIEQVIALNPDIVFAGNGLQHEQILTLTEVGVHVVSVEPTYYEDIAKSIRIIGDQIGKLDESEVLINKINESKEAVFEKSEGMEEHPTVYYVMSIGDNGYWTSGEGSFINSVIETAGGICVTAESGVEWPEYTAERLVAADPDILIVSSWVSEDDLISDSVMKELTAVKDGKYMFISDDLINRPGPRISEAMVLIQNYLLGEE